MNFTVKFKNESLFMKFLGTLMFFNPNFMTHYITTIGKTIYFPSRQWVNDNKKSAKIIVLHENIHIMDAAKLTQPLFSLLYLLPQWLVLVAIPLFFLHWFLALMALVFLLPLPAYFRMTFERRAYTFSIYGAFKYAQKNGETIDLDASALSHVSQFTTAGYYFMWPFKTSLTSYFLEASKQIQAGGYPFHDPKYYQVTDQLILDDKDIAA